MQAGPSRRPTTRALGPGWFTVASVFSDGFRNCVLRSLSGPERERMALELEPRNLQSGFVISEPGDTLTHVWFPETGVASLVAVMSDGALVETGTVGYE